jgi:hypothetical protein
LRIPVARICTATMNLLRRFILLTPLQRRLLIEVVLVVTFVSLGLRCFSFARVRQLLDRYARALSVTDRNTALRDARDVEHFTSMLQWALASVLTRMPGARSCLREALTANAILRRHGVHSQLRFGVRRNSTDGGPLEAHAWVVCDGRVAVGALDDLADFTPLNA